MGKSKSTATATGHKDIATLNRYYRWWLRTKQRMNEVFNIEEIPLKKNSVIWERIISLFSKNNVENE
jgi:hypothetical protein